MPGPDLYKKYRQRIEAWANDRRSGSLGSLRDLLKEFQCHAAMLEVATTNLVCDQLADQLGDEALRSTGKHRREILLAAVKGFDGLSFAKAKS
jgi:hypothetical protein